MKYYPTAFAAYQTSHFFVGATLILAIRVAGWPHWIGCLALLVWTLAKEFVFDLVVEKDTVAYSAIDFLFYWLGALTAAGFIRLVG